MTAFDQMTISAQNLRRRWPYTYALFIGILGLLVLVRLFAQQATPVDLSTLLLFTVTALIVSYFKVPICRTNPEHLLDGPSRLTALCDVELALDGAILLGATLVGGPAFGGWVAFVTELVMPMVPMPWEPPVSIDLAQPTSDGPNPSPLPSKDPPAERRPAKHSAPDAPRTLDKANALWRRLASFRQRPPSLPSRSHRQHIPCGWRTSALDNVAIGLLNGGRNVVAVGASWLAYRAMGGTIAPTTVDTPLALALIVLCVVYTFALKLCLWPALVLQGVPPLQALESQITPSTLMIELLPLPTALLVSATFVELGWLFFLILASVFIGLGAVMRQMLETIRTMRQQMDILSFTQRVRQAIIDTPQEVDDLCALAYPLCTEIAQSYKFELGLHDRTLTHVHIRVAVDDCLSLPPMRIPVTPLWAWLSERQEPLLVKTEAQFAALPFTLPPLGKGKAPRSAMFVPLPRPSQQQQMFSIRARRGSTDKANSGEPLANDLRKAVRHSAPHPAEHPLGAIVLQSPYPNAFSAQDVTRIAVIAEQLGSAIQKTRPADARASS